MYSTITALENKYANAISRRRKLTALRDTAVKEHNDAVTKLNNVNDEMNANEKALADTFRQLVAFTDEQHHTFERFFGTRAGDEAEPQGEASSKKAKTGEGFGQPPIAGEGFGQPPIAGGFAPGPVANANFGSARLIPRESVKPTTGAAATSKSWNGGQ